MEHRKLCGIQWYIHLYQRIWEWKHRRNKINLLEYLTCTQKYPNFIGKENNITIKIKLLYFLNQLIYIYDIA